MIGEATEVRSAFTRPDFGAGNVIEYLNQRKRMPDLRSRVLGRFDKLMNQIIAAGGVRVKGQSLEEAFNKGSRFIETADYYFLKELRNVPKGLFMSVLFDNPNAITNKNRR